MDQENLKFRVGLSSSFKRKLPKFNIGVNGKTFVETQLQNVDTIEYFEFTTIIDQETNYLEIVLLNKTINDTIKENEQIVDDMLLNIVSIEIDDIDLGELKWSKSKYYPIYPEKYTDTEQKKIKEINNCVDLGWNGTWKLEFSSPFYVWLLENL